MLAQVPTVVEAVSGIDLSRLLAQVRERGERETPLPDDLQAPLSSTPPVAPMPKGARGLTDA